MAKFVEIDGVYINPDRVAWVKPQSPEGPTLIWFSAKEDDYIIVENVRPITVVRRMADALLSATDEPFRR